MGSDLSHITLFEGTEEAFRCLQAIMGGVDLSGPLEPFCPPGYTRRLRIEIGRDLIPAAPDLDKGEDEA